ncbi:ribosome silencing factor [Candidatus Omnitrophota bacterium]
MPAKAVRSVGSIRKSRPNLKNKVKLVVQLASDKKAEDIIVLDMREIANFCDYFVICSGTSDRQVRAIARAVEDGLRKKKFRVYHREGLSQATWVVLDLGDVVLHVFDKETREFYQLDHLWQDAPVVEWNAR